MTQFEYLAISFSLLYSLTDLRTIRGWYDSIASEAAQAHPTRRDSSVAP